MLDLSWLWVHVIPVPKSYCSTQDCCSSEDVAGQQAIQDSTLLSTFTVTLMKRHKVLAMFINVGVFLLGLLCGCLLRLLVMSSSSVDS